MAPKIICDLCLKEFTVLQFAEHYENCRVFQNAFEIMVATNTPVKKRPLQPQKQQDSNVHPASKKFCFLTKDNDLMICSFCKQTYNPALKLRHFIKNHKNVFLKDLPKNNIESDFPIMVFAIETKLNERDLQEFYLNRRKEILQVFLYGLSKYRTLKFSLKIYGSFHKPTEVNTKLETKNFATPYMAIYELESLKKKLNEAIEYLTNLSRLFYDQASGWSILNFEKLEITLIKLEHIPILERDFVPNPVSIRFRNALVDVKSKDIYCFKWSILASIALNKLQYVVGVRRSDMEHLRRALSNPMQYFGVHISRKIIEYKGISLDFSGIEFPITRKGIKQFELNNLDFSINVYELDDNEINIVGPTIRTDQIKRNHIDLLALYNQKNQSMRYTCIASMEKLCSSQCYRSNPRVNFCQHCLEFYSKNHIIHKICREFVSYPPPMTGMVFEKPFNKISPPATIYANIDIITHISDEPKSWAVSYYVVHTHYPSRNKLWTYQGSDAMKKFSIALRDEAYSLYDKYCMESAEFIEIDPLEELNVDNRICCACEEVIEPEDLQKYYSQFTGELIGPIHTNCKPYYYLKDLIEFPVIFKKLSRNLVNLLLNELGYDLEPIPDSNGLYSVLKNFRAHFEGNPFYVNFMDASNFLQFSLDKVASNMDMKDLKNLYKYFPDGVQWEQIDKKIIFPKTYISSFSKTSDLELPQEHIFLEEGYSSQDYKFSQQVWSNFNCTSIESYINLYLKQDVLILADVFEYFRSLCLKNYSLEPTHYNTLTQLSWDAMLKVTKVNLDFIRDPNMHDFIKRGFRGPLIHSTPGIAKANNKYMRNFDPSRPPNYLACIEAKNLTDWAMSQDLPFSNFKFLNEDEIEKIDFRHVPHDGVIGYMLEVDLKYPTDLYNSHRSLPFCPEGREKFLGPTASLTDKKNYVIHLKNLQLCLQHGLVIENIHQVLSFEQKCWLKPYVNLNRYLIKKSKNEFEKHFFNLMSAKINECLQRKEICKVNLIRHYQSKPNSPGFRQRIARNNFHKVEIFGNGLAAIEWKQPSHFYESSTSLAPIYIGAAVSELSKWFIYDQYYNSIIPKCPSVRLLYMDTNLLVMHLKEDFYKLIRQNPSLFDTSNYKEYNKFKIVNANDNELGLIRDKIGGRIMQSFQTELARSYSVAFDED